MNSMNTEDLRKECRNYYLNQAMVKAYEKADARRLNHAVSPAGQRARKQYEMMSTQIAHVDQVRSAIRKDFGIEAERMFTCCCIDGMNLENIAARFSVSGMTCRKRICEWIEKEADV